MKHTTYKQFLKKITKIGIFGDNNDLLREMGILGDIIIPNKK